MDRITWSLGYNVTLHDARGRQPGDDEIDLLEALEAAGADGVAVGGTDMGMIGARFCVVASDGFEAFEEATAIMRKALATSGVRAGDPIDVEVVQFGDLVAENSFDGPRLIGAADIAKMIGVSRQRVYQLSGTDEFPEPIIDRERGKLWDRQAVLAWQDLWKRTPGRSPGILVIGPESSEPIKISNE